MVQELPRRALRSLTVVVALGLTLGCRGEARSTSEEAALARLVDSLAPQVEQVTGLTFKRKPRARMITRIQARSYLERQLARQLGGGRGAHIASSYRLLGLIPDSLDLQKLFVAVLTEQMAGYYDPDSSAFFGVSGGPQAGFTTIVAHELVHALQHDYIPLDSVMNARADGDRQVAAHSMLEGQATFAMMRMRPDVGERALQPEFWEAANAAARQQSAAMPEIAAAPRIIREGLIFPYLAGADYIRWWVTHHPPDEQPYGAAMPRSTEQILDPARNDVPLRVRLVGADSALYADDLGAAGMRVLLAEARGQAELVDPAFLGWGGDRFELYATPSGDALVWIAVFDRPAARDAMLNALVRDSSLARTGYTVQASATVVSDRPGLRLVVAPKEWDRWSALPTATAVPEP